MAGLALVAVAYVIAGRLGLELDPVSGFATLVWAPTGLAIAALVLAGRKLWPGVAVGALVVNLWIGAPIPAAAAIAAGNTLEALVAATLLALAGFDPAIGRTRDAGLLVLVAAATALISATVGVGALHVAGVLPPAAIPETWTAWWLGDALGALIIAPLLMTWSSPAARLRDGVSLLEVVGLLAVLAAGSAIVFSGTLPVPGPMGVLQQPYVLFAASVWAALRFGQRAATTVVFAVAALAVTATTLEVGPFVRPRLAEGLEFVQVFMAAVAVTSMLLAAEAVERRRRSAELARLNAQLRDAVRARDAILSVASHDLKNPLGVLRIQADALLASDGHVPESVAVGLRRIDRQVGQLSTMLDRLLDVSQITAGALQLEPEELELSGLVRDVAARFEENTRAAGRTLRIEVDDSVVGWWDPVRLDQVVSNLISNAVRYGAGQPIEIRVSASNGRARIQVEDHGIGIAPEDQARIFEQFERVSPRRGATGSGLGLWICRQIVEAMHGVIRVESAPGAGATFTVEIPVGMPHP